MTGLLVACLALGFLPRPTLADDTTPEVRKFLAAWAGSLSDVKTLRVRFRQTKRLRILRKPRVSVGLMLLKGKRVLMQIDDLEGNRETELLVDEREVRIHYPRLKRLEIYEIREGQSHEAPFPMLGSDVVSLPDTYRIRLEGDEETRVLHLHPRLEGSKFKWIQMSFEELKIVEVQQESPKGDQVTLRITEFTVNPEIDDGALKLEIPPDTRIVRMGSSRNKSER